MDTLLEHDPFLLLADFRSYLDAQEEAGRVWLDQDVWTRRSIVSVARMGRFSSDRTIREYADQVWQITPVAP